MLRLRTFLLLALLAPALLPAQDLGAHPWAAWFGCWVPTESAGGERPVTCVVPSADGASAVEVISSVNGTLLRQSRIAADGVRVPFDQNGCVGWDAAEFSGDGARVYFTGEVTCGTRGTQMTSGVYAFAPGGVWLDVQVVRTGEERSMRSQRLELLPLSALPAELHEDFEPLERLAMSARAATLSVPLTVGQVAEVAAKVDAAAAEIWVIESSRDAAQPLRLRRAELRALAQAKVPERVIDAAVAVANPADFYVEVAAGRGLIAQLSQSTTGGGGALTPRGNMDLRCNLGVWNDLYFQPSGFAMFMGFNAPFQYQWPYDVNCFNPFFGRGWFDRSGQLGYLWYGPPQSVTATVTPRDQLAPPSRPGSTYNGGRVVQGGGYRAPNSGGTASSPASSSGSGSTSSGTSSGSSGRTAKPRNPNP